MVGHGRRGEIRLPLVVAEQRRVAVDEGHAATSADVGLRLDTQGYDFLRYDSRKELWQSVSDDPMLRPRGLPAGLTLQLRLEGRDVVFRKNDDTDLLKKGEPVIQPQVVVQASGDLVPFDIFLRRDGTTEERRVSGTLDGKIEIHNDARERQQ